MPASFSSLPAELRIQIFTMRLDEILSYNDDKFNAGVCKTLRFSNQREYNRAAMKPIRALGLVCKTFRHDLQASIGDAIRGIGPEIENFFPRLRRSEKKLQKLLKITGERRWYHEGRVLRSIQSLPMRKTQLDRLRRIVPENRLIKASIPRLTMNKYEMERLLRALTEPVVMLSKSVSPQEERRIRKSRQIEVKGARHRELSVIGRKVQDAIEKCSREAKEARQLGRKPHAPVEVAIHYTNGRGHFFFRSGSSW
ncbi:MAG: hypothetical protein M1828_007211 [Chrysothrix sp. TS-e1954]|nr:MAG: hypothetical protein M1828_007211 [Chrysothrix sp. TS-e1954]